MRLMTLKLTIGLMSLAASLPAKATLIVDQSFARNYYSDRGGVSESGHVAGAIFLIQGSIKDEKRILTVSVCDEKPNLFHLNSHFKAKDFNKTYLDDLCHSPIEISLEDSKMHADAVASNKGNPDFWGVRYFALEKAIFDLASEKRAYDYDIEFKRRIADPYIFREATIDNMRGFIEALFKDYSAASIKAAAANEPVGYISTLRAKAKERAVYSGILQWQLLATTSKKITYESNAFVRTESTINASEYQRMTEQVQIQNIHAAYSKVINDGVATLAVPEAKGCAGLLGPGWRLPTLEEVQSSAADLAKSEIGKLIGSQWIATQSVDNFYDFHMSIKDGLAMQVASLNEPGSWKKSESVSFQNLRAYAYDGDARRLKFLGDFLTTDRGSKPLIGLCVKPVSLP